MSVKRKHLTRHEVRQILLATDRGLHFARDYCLIQMCFLHGLRVSELCDMRLSDIDLAGRSTSGGSKTASPRSIRCSTPNCLR